ncbi:probable TonB-dependent iron complex outermembrane receptor protein [Thiobacillus denitrificans ATCC 25259]|uniref:Probable TonB-dependent iron complex outermembrane receptor protein n=1 Tax=Thiobacillus denitrificans (strain ATCC 25259 / T1) TaxID=292415 RepID=Q3SJE5_THIDA|nr:probable TonB-dependent iron complex outermembrane receptor protein [Thiobacillus denitrificans ATCC 25259]
MSRFPKHLSALPRPNHAPRTSGRLRALSFLLPALPLLAGPVQASPLDLDITQMSLEQLMEISVTGASKYEQKQSEVAAAVSVITRDEIRTYGWRTLAEALASLPGVHTTYDRQYSYVGARGFGLPGDFNSRLLLTVDGNRANEVVYGTALMGREFLVDLDLVERIEYIPGPGGAVYGQNALFGVVNVVTRTGADVNGGEVALAHSTLDSGNEGRATWGGVLDNGVDVLLSASAYEAEGRDLYFDYGSSGVAGVASGMDGERDKQFFGRAGRGPWSFDFSYGERRKDDPIAAYKSDPLVPGQYAEDRHLLTQLQYQDRFAGGTLQVSGRLFLGRERFRGLFHRSGDAHRYAFSSDWQGMEVRLVSTARADHKTMFGFEYQDNARQDQSVVGAAAGVMIPGAGWRAGVYAQDEWTLTETLSATLGVRADRSDVSGSALSPRLALVWQMTPDTTLKAMYGRAFRAPNALESNLGDGVTQLPNPNLDAERIDTLELLAEQRVTPSLRLRATAYRWTMQGLVTLAGLPGGFTQYQNGADIEARGVELSADKTWDWGGRIRGSLSRQDACYADGPVLLNSPRLLGKLNVSSPVPQTGLRLGYELQYSADRRAVDGTDVPGYWLSNLNLVADKWARGLELSLGLYNLLDRDYAQPGSAFNWQNVFEQDGRSARLKAVYRF